MPHPALHPARGRFLHLVHDEKFIDAARAIFEEAAPGAHDFVRIGELAPLRYIRTFQPVALGPALLERGFLSDLPRYSAVFVHYLSEPARLVVALAPPATRFIWLGWGADYYHLIRSPDELLLSRTRALAARPLPPAPPPPGRLRSALQHAGGMTRALLGPIAAARRIHRRRTLRSVGPHGKAELALINRFHAVAMPVEEDFHALRARHAQLTVPFLDWNYWTEGFPPTDARRGPTGNDILLGNSAAPANNHVEALELLARVMPPGRKVVCPLSYGDAGYGDAIEAEGRRLLGTRFVPLRNFMDSAAYADVIANCSIVVMNHVRQQAVGNIILALHAGAHVFLRRDNPVHAAMQRIGVPIHDVETLPQFLQAGEPPVADASLDDVRRRLEDQYGRPSILRRTRVLLEDVGSDRKAAAKGER